MTTSDSNWEIHFPTAVNCCIGDDIGESAQSIINSRLEAIEAKYLVWLTELPDAIEEKLAGKSSTTWNMLPKTPSVKSRAQARARVKAIQEEETSSNTPDEIKPINTILHESKSSVITESPKGRPKRSCRNRTTTSRTTTTRAGIRTSKNMPPQQNAVVSQNKQPLDAVEETESKTMSSNVDENAAKVAVSKTKAVTCSRIGFKEDADKESPSVRDRARAYETMLKIKSPIKTQRVATPMSNGPKNFASATISSLAKSSPQPVVCLTKQQPSSPAPSPRPLTLSSKKSTPRRSRRSSRRSSRISKSSSQHLGTPSKPTRSKLALKKKSLKVALHQINQVTSSSPAVEVDVKKGKTKSRSSQDSAVSSASSTMSAKSNSREDELNVESNSEDEQNIVAKEDEKEQEEEDMDEGLDMTHTVITEVYDLSADGKQNLVDYEKIQTKTTPLTAQDSVSDTQTSKDDGDNDSNDNSSTTAGDDNDNDSSNNSLTTAGNDNGGSNTFTKDSPVDPLPVRTTRTRARAVQSSASSNSSLSEEISKKQSRSVSSTYRSSYTELKSSPSKDMDEQSEEEEQQHQQPRTTRTRARAKIQQEEVEKKEETGGVRTRTRQRQVSKDATEISTVRDVSVVSTNNQKAPAATASFFSEDGGEIRSTRSRMRQRAEAEHLPCGAYDEVVAGSPAMKTANSIRCSKKRPVEEYGNSPKPKRSRSCAGMSGPNSTFNAQSILLTSSPRREQDDGEYEDTVDSSLMSPVRKQSKPFAFTNNSALKSSFMKRTPAFAKTNSKLYSFLGSSTPSQNNGRALSSFLKRHTPVSKTGAAPQVLHEQKKQKLQEKESKERERLKRAAETKKQKLEEQKRLRDDRLRKVREAREKKTQEEMEQKERMFKKFEDHAVLSNKMLEEKLRAETEKKEVREKKMMEANSRRRQEEEERLRKKAEMEEEDRRQQHWLQRKKECEEEERKRHLEEEKRKQEERMQKIIEEKAKQRRLEEEKRERKRKEREFQIAQEKALERAEKDRIERERREEKERRLEELRRQEEQKRVEEQRRLQEIRRNQEQEKIRIMEAAHKRANDEAARLEREREAKKAELQKLISQCKSGSSHNTSITAKESASSYMITPKKTYKPSTDPNNYGIDDKGSDESTDEEDAPKKKIPEWAMGVYLNAALIKQHKYPPDINNIFRPHLVDAPDLTKLFPTSRHRHRFKYRTSSAIWTSPAMKK